MHRPGRLHDARARGARTQLMRIQAERRKRESDNTARDQAAWIEHCAIGLMMQAQLGGAPVAMPDPPPPPPAPEPPPADEPRTDLAAEADLYAIMYPRRAVRMRALGGLPQPLDFGAPSPELLRAIITGDSPGLRALDAEAVA